MAHETAGDPVSGLKWTRRTTAKLADELHGPGIDVCPQTVARLLKAMGYSLRVNHKKLAGASHPNRDQQFRHITQLRKPCAADHSPLISVDTKKKELVGTFRNPGATWDRSPELVNDHDFRSDADGLAVPYGIYDPRANVCIHTNSGRLARIRVLFRPARIRVSRNCLGLGPGPAPARPLTLADGGPRSRGFPRRRRASGACPAPRIR